MHCLCSLNFLGTAQFSKTQHGSTQNLQGSKHPLACMHANQKLYKFAVIYNVDNPERKKKCTPEKFEANILLHACMVTKPLQNLQLYTM